VRFFLLRSFPFELGFVIGSQQSKAIMKTPTKRDETTRFSGALRHYHRANSRPPRTWDDWVEGKATESSSTNWLKITAVIVALLALFGVIAGLVIELS
jgi:hypothetical protein